MRRTSFGKYIFCIALTAAAGASLCSLLYRASSFVLKTLGPAESEVATDATPSTVAINKLDAAPISYDKSALGKADLSHSVHIDPQNLRNVSLRAQAYLIKDLDTGEEVLSKNGAEKFPIASVTKLITAMVALDNIKEDELVKVSKRAVSTYGQQGGLVAGERFKAVDLINCLLLESSNDSAEALAEHFGREKFLKLMNGKVEELEMFDTKFQDPSGLIKTNVSTPEDLSKLVAYIENNRPDILRITRKKSYRVEASALSRRHVWVNINRLVKDNNNYYSGGKDGFTGDALMTFAGAFAIPLNDNEEKRFSIALLRSSDRNSDISKIINRVIASLRYGDGMSFKPVTVKKGAVVDDGSAVSVMAVGDIATERVSSTTFEYMPFLRDPDVVFGNLEGVASDLGYNVGGYASARLSPSILPALKEAGFDALSVANEHAGDWGLSAFEDMLGRFRKNGLMVVGGGLSGAEARREVVVEKNGIKLGFLGFSDVGPSWLGTHDNLPTILLFDEDSFDSNIKEAVAAVDHLIVSMHFGQEYSAGASERQRELAHRAIDNGAKLVIGHHSHLAEKLESYNGGVIAYSLGDFITATSSLVGKTSGSVIEALFGKDEMYQVNQSYIKDSGELQPMLVEESGV